MFEIIAKRIKDEELLWLVNKVIESYCSSHPEFISGSQQIPKQVRHDNNRDCFSASWRIAMTKRNKGIPIGNLSSQLFANIYLNELDQFVKHLLKAKYYLRYADDFVVLSADKSVLENYLLVISRFLEENLQLKLHANKTTFRKLSWGIDLLGYIALPYYEVLRTKTKRRVERKICGNFSLYKQGKISKQTFEQSLASYFGILKHASAYKLKKTLIKSLPQEFTV